MRRGRESGGRTPILNNFEWDLGRLLFVFVLFGRENMIVHGPKLLSLTWTCFCSNDLPNI